MKLLFIILTVFLSFTSSAETFWAQDRDSSEPYEVHGDPRRVEALYWIIKLYREGQSTGGNDQWGIIMENSYDACVRRLREAQANELAALKALKSPRKSSWTYFNPLGPIAVLRSDDRFGNVGLLFAKERLKDPDSFTKEIGRMYQNFKNALAAIELAKANDPQIMTRETPRGKRFRSFTEAVNDSWRTLLKRSDENVEAIRSWGELLKLTHDDFLKLISGMGDFNRAMERSLASFQSVMGLSRPSGTSSASGSSISSASTFRWNDAPFVVTQKLELSPSRLILELGYEHRDPSSSHAFRFVVNINNLQRSDSTMRLRDDQGQTYYAIKVQCRTVDEFCMDRYRISTGSLANAQWANPSKGSPSDTLTIYFRTEAELEDFKAKLP